MSRALWTSHQIAAACGGRAGGAIDLRGIAVDSREVVPGDLFVALTGQQSDGHAHVASALNAGAAAALVDRPCAGVRAGDSRLITCPDTRQALRTLAVTARDRGAARRVAVTGSAGKTGVRRALESALASLGPTHASIRSFNNHVGVPLSLARMPQDSAVGVFEAGMNAPGEIAALADLIRPHVGIVTTVGAAHLAAFKDETGIAEEKGALFHHLAPGGTAIVNLDGGHAERLISIARSAEAGRIVTVSLDNPDATIHATKTAFAAECTCMTVQAGPARLMVKVGIPGRAWAQNALLVLAAAHATGADLGQAGLALAALRPSPGRGRRTRCPVAGGEALVIDDSYNANPLSLRAALSNLAVCTPEGRGRRVAVLGDMSELGDDAEAHHRALAPDLIAAGVADVIATGPHSESLGRAAGVRVHRLEGTDGAAAYVRACLRPGDVVLIKGSNAAGLGALVAALTDPRADGSRPAWANFERAA